MSDLLSSISLGQVGAGTLLAVVIYMILTDRLVTRQRLVDEQEEKKRWRSAYETLLPAVDKLVDGVSRTVVLAETTNHALVEIRNLAGRIQEAKDV